MSQITIVIAIIVISFVSLSYAQEDQKLSVTTSHNFYENGDVVVISGQAKPIIKNVPVIIQIISDALNSNLDSTDCNPYEALTK